MEEGSGRTVKFCFTLVISCTVMYVVILMFVSDQTSTTMGNALITYIPQRLQMMYNETNILTSAWVALFVENSQKTEQFKDALKRVTSSDRTVLLTLVDEAFMPMALNFYLTCLKPYNITNYLILTMHNQTCSHLTPHRINCYFYKNIGSAELASKFGTQVFNNKMNVRTDMILDALNLGYSVLHTDIDMYYYSNPFKSISCTAGKCDIAVLMDTYLYNAGFLLIHPSPTTIGVYKFMKELSKNDTRLNDQAQLNRAMERQVKEPGGLKVVRLSVAKFQCGVTFYENPKRYFFDSMKPCTDCVVVHNNWIVSMEAKVYRAKELHQWIYDGDQYYTSTKRKYLTYNNPEKSDNVEGLKSALAIAQVLNRTLILPKFRCKVMCPLNSFIMLTPFDKYFQYREHSFINHPLVPDSIKSSLSPMYLIVTKSILTAYPKIKEDNLIKQINPMDMDKGMNNMEIFKQFGSDKEAILQFHSMSGAFSGFTNPNEQKRWVEKLKAGLVKGSYRQV